MQIQKFDETFIYFSKQFLKSLLNVVKCSYLNNLVYFCRINYMYHLI